MPTFNVPLHPTDRNASVDAVLGEVEFRNENGFLLTGHSISGNTAVLEFSSPPGVMDLAADGKANTRGGGGAASVKSSPKRPPSGGSKDATGSRHPKSKKKKDPK